MNQLIELAREFLGTIESREIRLLGWGHVDGSFSYEEILELVEDFLDEGDLLHEIDPVPFLELLVDHGLLVRLRYSNRDVIRSRMGETIRLAARLKQLFESDVSNGRWPTAPNLVADYRLDVRPRRYPRRDLEADDLVERLAGLGISTLGLEVARTLLRVGGEAAELSGFQWRATEKIAAGWGQRESGLILTAGTGSGKSLAFYLPVLVRVAEHTSPWRRVSALAVYPRKELLKDQFSESFRQVRLVNGVLGANGRRPISMAAYFGDAPFDTSRPRSGSAWHRVGDAFVCPYLRCPDCDSEMVWRGSDMDANVERLVCRRPECDVETDSDTLPLTRRSIQSATPDLLFTTTEMLNRHFGNSWSQHLFGIGVERPPDIVLLDEVHTYSGSYGAQVALLMRRWRHATGKRAQIVGLSATLSDPVEFFSQFTGVVPPRIHKVGPTGSEMFGEGMEYLIVARSDPASGVSVLSTTIQTAMLMGRCLDSASRPSDWTYGRRSFLFTDDLDVTNRLFYYLRDAEGWDKFGRPLNDPVGRPHGSLANLRSPMLSDRPQRLASGQSWDLAESLGHPLSPGPGLKIGRTSSQDAGVDAASDVVVATASLEVGYNDPEVGAVIQHKAPRDLAQFLQRRGRAGRDRRTRPWTIVVLSDYGRDRLTYDAYERLFDPEIRTQPLPLLNPYVLRIQAAFATLDWIGENVGAGRGSIWSDLAQPASGPSSNRRARQEGAIDLIDRVLAGGPERKALFGYLRSALSVEPAVVANLAWSAPRSLLLEVLPTIRRRLDANWGLAFPKAVDEREFFEPRLPIPEFIPAAMFSDLAVPEVVVRTPSATRHDTDETHHLGAAQAIREFSPGRVTLRYAVKHGWIRHWVAPGDDDDAADTIETESTFPNATELGSFPDREGASVTVLRPWEIRPVAVPRSIADTSNAYPDWQTSIRPRAAAVAFETPQPSPWGATVMSLAFYLHTRESGVVTTRYAVASAASIRYRSGKLSERRIGYRVDGQPAAIGFDLSVDAVEFECEVPVVNDRQISPATLRSARTNLFVDRCRSDSTLRSLTGEFAAERLATVYLSLLVSVAMREDISLEMSQDFLQAEGFVESLAGAFEAVFQAALVVDEEAFNDHLTSSDEETIERRGRLHQTLRDLIALPQIQARLVDIACVLWSEPDESWEEWLKARYMATLGAALLDAVRRLVPDIEDGSLVLDLNVTEPRAVSEDDAESGPESIWISETTMGGAGPIERFLQLYAEDPRGFFSLVESALRAQDFEIVDSELTRLVGRLQSDGVLREAVSEVRGANSHEGTRVALDRLVLGLERQGYFASHPVVAALSSRILRPGSSDRTDAILSTLLRRWLAEEERLGIEIDSSVISFGMSEDDELDDALGVASGTRGVDRTWRMGVLNGMLWPRGSATRSAALSTYNPYEKLPATDRLLFHDVSPIDTDEVEVSGADWRETLMAALQSRGRVLLWGDLADTRALGRAVLDLISEAVEVGFLQLYPRVVSTHRSLDRVSVTFELKDWQQ